jgi:RimJ/RimL family protein N-acetyltransferase
MSIPFRSRRLLYRAFNSPEDDEFFARVKRDPIAFGNIAPILQRPMSNAYLNETKKDLQDKMLLYVIICKIREDDATEEAATETSAGNANPGGHTKKRTKTWMEIEKDSEPIGTLCLSSTSALMAVHRSTEIGISILEAYQGQGYGTESIRWVTDWAFREAGMHRVGISALGWNERAAKLYQRLGFKLEGRQREIFWRDGQWWDYILMAMTEDDWRQLKEI